MKSNELRKLYMDFFIGKQHSARPSSSLIPEDPSLLFTVAGMVPFKNYFLGKVPLTFTRAASCQKCIRTNDIENVGRTRRHHTFFEMLGNFSFGDYFKEEAIAWAWEFLTEVVKLPKSKLYITVYNDDDAAFDIWNKKMKVPADRIFRMGKATNFWEMGTVGPCGYCSEIYVDMEDGGKTEVTARDIEENDNRFLEVWNLVFTEFDKKEDGSLGKLEQKNIDTGMGLERLAAVSQGVKSNFDSDLFMPLINDVCAKAKTQYGKSEKTDISLRVIADHARGVSFLIGDGVLPSNEGRGYVLRRIIRRAIRHGRLLGMKEPFLHKVVPVVTQIMGEAYPELAERREYITQIIKLEEDKFQDTMDKGMEMLSQEIDKLEKGNKKELGGDIAFKLYDTYGFPVEITKEILLESGRTVDMAGFTANMEKQREMAKRAWKGVNSELAESVPKSVIEKLKVTEFLGYEKTQESCRITAIVKDKKETGSIKSGDTAYVILDRTPFYAESGGQVGDTGAIIQNENRADVIDTQKIDERFIHKVKVIAGEFKVKDEVTAGVDLETRKATEKNHTATHLLHAALRAILGLHVEQAGSHVSPGRLRFDFTHFAQLTDAEIRKAEEMVNIWAQACTPLVTEEMDYEEARKKGAMALFEDKYKAKVRTVTVPGVSMELCGGTHLKNTGEIGLFKIISSGSTAAGVRRIEAVTGKGALALMHGFEDALKELREKFKADSTEELAEKAAKLISENRELSRKLADMRKNDAVRNSDGYIESAKAINGAKLVIASLENADKDSVRQLGDLLKAKSKNSVILVTNSADSKISFLIMVTDDLTHRLDAGRLVKEAATVCGGGGGGRKDMAEAGGKDPSKLAEALERIEKIMKEAK